MARRKRYDDVMFSSGLQQIDTGQDISFDMPSMALNTGEPIDFGQPSKFSGMAGFEPTGKPILGLQQDISFESGLSGIGPRPGSLARMPVDTRGGHIGQNFLAGINDMKDGIVMIGSMVAQNGMGVLWDVAQELPGAFVDAYVGWWDAAMNGTFLEKVQREPFEFLQDIIGPLAAAATMGSSTMAQLGARGTGLVSKFGKVMAGAKPWLNGIAIGTDPIGAVAFVGAPKLLGKIWKKHLDDGGNGVKKATLHGNLADEAAVLADETAIGADFMTDAERLGLARMEELEKLTDVEMARIDAGYDPALRPNDIPISPISVDYALKMADTNWHVNEPVPPGFGKIIDDMPIREHAEHIDAVIAANIDELTDLGAGRNAASRRPWVTSMSEALGVAEDQIRTDLSAKGIGKLGISFNFATRNATIHRNKLLRAMDAGAATDEMIAAFTSSQAKLKYTVLSFFDATSEVGRAMNFIKRMNQVIGASADQIDDILAAAGGKHRILKLAKMSAAADTPQKMAAMGQKMFNPTWADKLLEVVINWGMLSGPLTHMVNITSNSLISLWRIPETMMSATLNKAFPTAKTASGLVKPMERVYYREVVARVYGMVEGAKSGIQAAKHAFMTETPFVLGGQKADNYQRAIGGALGKVARWPGRFLLGADAAFQSIAYHSELRALAMRSAIDKGLGAGDMAKHIVDFVTNPPKKLQIKAFDAAKYMTFTKPLGESGRHIQALAATTPVTKFFAPFIRTPLNILKYAGERTPLAFFNKAIRAELAAGGARQSEALAKMVLGSSAIVAVMSLTEGAQGFVGDPNQVGTKEKGVRQGYNGTITGGGPADPKQREALRNTGWLPYAIKMDGKYYSYARFEPLGILFGVAADFAEITDHMSSGEADQLGTLIVSAVTNNLTNKTWLRGLSDVLSVLADPERNMDKFKNSLVGLVVPNVVNQVGQFVRAYQTESMTGVEGDILPVIHTWMDRIKSRIGGGKGQIDMWGNLIQRKRVPGTPIYVGDNAQDPVSVQMWNDETYFGRINRDFGQIEMSTDLHQAVQKYAGKGAYRELHQLINDPYFMRLPKALRRDEYRKVVYRWRQQAMDVLIKPRPEYQAALEQYELGRLQMDD